MIQNRRAFIHVHVVDNDNVNNNINIMIGLLLPTLTQFHSVDPCLFLADIADSWYFFYRVSVI